MTAPRTTGDITDAIVEAVTTGEHEVAGAVKSGRRWTDWRAIFSVRSGVSVFFYIFGALLDEKKKPSMSRIILVLWTYVGWLLMKHEIALVAGQPAITNAAWQAWWAFGGMISFAVFGPRIASYFGVGAAGAVSAGAIAGAIRDAVVAHLPNAAPPVTTTTTTTATRAPDPP